MSTIEECSKCDAVDVRHHPNHHYHHHHRHHYVRHHQKQENLKIQVTTLHGYRYLAKGGLSTLIWFYHITNYKGGFDLHLLCYG